MSAAARIGIAGAGGLGSNLAMNLVRSGVGPLKIVDMDAVEASNLNRQFFFHDQIGQPKVQALKDNLLRIDPQAQLQVEQVRLTEDNCEAVFSGCSIVVEAVDVAATKKLLFERFAGDKLFIAASGVAGSEVSTIYGRRLGRAWVFGDFESDAAERPLYSHKIQAVVAWMTARLLEERG